MSITHGDISICIESLGVIKYSLFDPGHRTCLKFISDYQATIFTQLSHTPFW